MPPQLLDPPRRAHSGLRGGMVLVGLGIGLGRLHVRDEGQLVDRIDTGIDGRGTAHRLGDRDARKGLSGATAPMAEARRPPTPN